jgi:hypothetical protein
VIAEVAFTSVVFPEAGTVASMKAIKHVARAKRNRIIFGVCESGSGTFTRNWRDRCDMVGHLPVELKWDSAVKSSRRREDKVREMPSTIIETRAFQEVATCALTAKKRDGRPRDTTCVILKIPHSV